MALGKTIRIYLVDGEPTGIRMVDLSSWTGEAFVCQRSQLASLAQRPEAKRTGVESQRHRADLQGLEGSEARQR